MIKLSSIIITILALTACDPVHYELRGQIRSHDKGIQNAKVSLQCPKFLPRAKTTTSDEMGKFRFTGNGVINNCFLQIERNGFILKEIKISENDIIDSRFPFSPLYEVKIQLNQSE